MPMLEHFSSEAQERSASLLRYCFFASSMQGEVDMVDRVLTESLCEDCILN